MDEFHLCAGGKLDCATCAGIGMEIQTPEFYLCQLDHLDVDFGGVLRREVHRLLAGGGLDVVLAGHSLAGLGGVVGILSV